jgi:hypothetical protein
LRRPKLSTNKEVKRLNNNNNNNNNNSGDDNNNNNNTCTGCTPNLDLGL